MSRLPHGGRIDRDRPLDFSFNGRLMTGYAGDTLAAALLANDVVRVARSFKYGRPRGIVGHGVEEPNAIVQLGTGADSVPAIIREMLSTTQSERQGRLIDHDQAGSMERKKQEGYF